MKTKKQGLRIAIVAVVVSAGLFIYGAHAAQALDRPLIYSPKDGNLLDQPLQVVGTAPVKSVVRITMNGKVLTRISVAVPKVKKGKKVPATTTFTYTYKKTLTTGKYVFTFQTIQGATVSELATGKCTGSWFQPKYGISFPLVS